MKPSRAHLAWSFLLVPLALVPACAIDERVSVGVDCEAGFCPAEAGATFTPPPAADGGEGGAVASPIPVLTCVGTQCPAPYVTCGSTPTFLCRTNLENDANNCGACGVSCAGFEGINLGSRCVKGACAFECMIKKGPMNESHQFRDCNSLLDDGCEIDVTADPANCGVCGNACQAGQRCIDGKCGCPGGKTDCNGTCTDTRFDDGNCGTCGTQCDPYQCGKKLGVHVTVKNDTDVNPTRLTLSLTDLNHIADDDADWRTLLQEALAPRFPDAQIDLVNDGEQAIAAFEKHPYSVVLVDLQMPELDGMELTARLRSLDASDQTPIIVMTAAGGPGEWRRLSQIGADAFLVKPVAFDDVAMQIRRTMKSRHRKS
ncbi:MAG: Tryptophan synthase alpha chain [Labilithrix sp.]|nr:Tryptophan synthase alpha chain [Labilithrix sp.]